MVWDMIIYNQLLDELTIDDYAAPFTHPSEERRELGSLLTMSSIVRTESINAHKYSAAALAPQQADFVKIGAGACGMVFAHVGKSTIIKFQRTAKIDLANDFRQHVKIASCLDRWPVHQVKIPGCLGFHHPEHEMDFLGQFPKLAEAAQGQVNLPTPILVADRILPLPQPVRELLISQFCPPNLQQQARDSVSNQDCLVRPYLGKTCEVRPQSLFNLRNFKLHLNEMDSLQLDVESIGHAMGQTLAVLHWGAQTDARDVEFVLGSTATRSVAQSDKIDWDAGPRSETWGVHSYDDFADFKHRKVEMYLLDFNLVRNITMDEEGIKAAVDAFRANDPYYPRPCQPRGARVWRAFISGYLQQSVLILPNPTEVQRLAVGFLNGIREVYGK